MPFVVLVKKFAACTPVLIAPRLTSIAHECLGVQVYCTCAGVLRLHSAAAGRGLSCW